MDAKSADAPIIQVIAQRHQSDCGVAALAMICGVSYEESLLALGGEVPEVLTKGVLVKELQRAATRLGYALRRHRRIDWDEDTGILGIVFENRVDEHVVVLRAGLIVDTDGTLWNAHDYMRVKRARPGLLLIPEGRGE